jgi:hypothetical protein
LSLFSSQFLAGEAQSTKKLRGRWAAGDGDDCGDDRPRHPAAGDPDAIAAT